jgi:hypothetical protein
MYSYINRRLMLAIARPASRRRPPHGRERPLLRARSRRSPAQTTRASTWCSSSTPLTCAFMRLELIKHYSSLFIVSVVRLYAPLRSLPSTTVLMSSVPLEPRLLLISQIYHGFHDAWNRLSEFQLTLYSRIWHGTFSNGLCHRNNGRLFVRVKTSRAEGGLGEVGLVYE